MRAVAKFATLDGDVVQDIQFDYYGKRVAIASSDMHIKVWDPAEDGQFQCSSDWKAHNGTIWKISWAYPEFGQLLASCSSDRLVHIWQEPLTSASSSSAAAPSSDPTPAGGKRGRGWELKATLADSRDQVVDVAFAPPILGLKLAICSTDGYVRIYQCDDVVKLNYWHSTEEFSVNSPGGGPESSVEKEGRADASAERSCNCLSWNPQSRTTDTDRGSADVQSIVVGSASGELQIWDYDDSSRKWKCALKIPPTGGLSSGNSILDVAWAPSLGRSFDVIAAGSKDGKVHIYKVQRVGETYRVNSHEEIADHGAEVWKVEWNISGTVLASSGEDGKVRLWRSDAYGKFFSAAVIEGEADAAPSTPSTAKEVAASSEAAMTPHPPSAAGQSSPSSASGGRLHLPAAAGGRL